MQIFNPGESIGPVSVTLSQAREIKRRLSEVPRVQGVPWAIQEVMQGADKVDLSVEAVVGNLSGDGWKQKASSDKPVFPFETRERIAAILRAVSFRDIA